MKKQSKTLKLIEEKGKCGLPITDFLNTEPGYYAMKKFLISEFSPEGILFLTDWYFLKQKFQQIAKNELILPTEEENIPKSS